MIPTSQPVLIILPETLRDIVGANGTFPITHVLA